MTSALYPLPCSGRAAKRAGRNQELAPGEWLCPLATAARGLPETRSPAHPGPMALGLANGPASSCLPSCLPHCLGPGLRPTGAATAGQEDPSPKATALHPWLPGYCLLPSPSFLPAAWSLLGLAPGPEAPPSQLGRVDPGQGRAAAPLGKTLTVDALGVLRVGRRRSHRTGCDRGLGPLTGPASPPSRGRRAGCASTSCRTFRSPWTISGTAR